MEINAAFKNQLVVAGIVVGAIILAIPIFIFSFIGVLWGVFTFWARPVAAEKIRRSAESAGARIAGQAGNVKANLEKDA
jgi:hypothetical protein